ncbi:alpha-L-rhamnosidase-related protein [Paenibacillus nasutitermitis]|uniref:Alpha-rhamnosidase n=1 Tax=Paenibacillus nasutitermitis TaxID=1652958 RepID=A0A916ZA40_9BACL|nr:alpha-L-rhamnosidase C-terminal domain-containing protein [Paenibacillus nasutitermitis]GGD82352.1 alpha-rhamnosidase [Paenibacillus nasutitermitis]
MQDHLQRATWIWYPDDYEIWLHQKVSVLRQFRGYICPPSWRLDAAYTSVKFRKTFDLTEPELLTLSVQGEFVLLMDGSMTPIPYKKTPITSVHIPAGRHELTVNVYNDREIPAMYASGATCGTDGTWEVTALNGKWVPVASWTFHHIEQPPAAFPFSYETRQPAAVTNIDGGVIVDFGRETFGTVSFLEASGQGGIHLYYGESLEEAMAGEGAETFDTLAVNSAEPLDRTTSVTRAFRYIQIKTDPGISYAQIEHRYEYLPMERRGEFRCSDPRLNEIWEMSAHTLHINMREFLYDGMKRDRWVWSGDANLGFLINNYSFFEQDVAKRTMIALRGKEPVEIHINTIMDYTLYWFLSVHDYYLYTGDLAFVRSCYPKLVSLMEFCLNRRNEAGMLEGYPEDWVFIDWAPMERRGELAAEQLLFCRSLEAAALFAGEVGDSEGEARYGKLTGRLRETIYRLFWDDEQGGLIHGRYEGELNRQLLKYPNIFATRFHYLDEGQREAVREKVLKNDAVQKINTPFMRFYELDALCLLGEHDYVFQEVREYWGGMLDLGATTFWEEYDPAIPAERQYDMYGDKFRKSLCHAWGAAPIYLIGKYMLGVKPTEPGYSRYQVEPKLCGLEWIEGKVPTPDGEIAVYMDAWRIRVTANDSGIGVLKFKCAGRPIVNAGELTAVGGDEYELLLTSPSYEYEIELGRGDVHA